MDTILKLLGVSNDNDSMNIEDLLSENVVALQLFGFRHAQHTDKDYKPSKTVEYSSEYCNRDENRIILFSRKMTLERQPMKQEINTF